MNAKNITKENYYQICGRPHSGLENPSRFGLSHEQVVDLIERGKWKSFYNNWRQKRKREKQREKQERKRYQRTKKKKKTQKKKKYKCFCCKTYFLIKEAHITINKTAHLCEKCVLRIKRLSHAVRDRNNSEIDNIST